jgi:hypothetical protein
MFLPSSPMEFIYCIFSQTQQGCGDEFPPLRYYDIVLFIS